MYEIITVQRDFGNRSDRKLSRLKYTIDKLGIDQYRAEVEKRAGFSFEPAREFKFTQRKDRYGWIQNHEGKWFYTVFVEHGRILDIEGYPLKSGLLKLHRQGKPISVLPATKTLFLLILMKKISLKSKVF